MWAIGLRRISKLDKWRTDDEFCGDRGELYEAASALIRNAEGGRIGCSSRSQTSIYDEAMCLTSPERYWEPLINRPPASRELDYCPAFVTMISSTELSIDRRCGTEASERLITPVADSALAAR